MTEDDDDEGWRNVVEMEFKRTYTLVDIARKLDRPRTTVKEWSDLFREYLPTVGTGRTMRYEEPAVDIFVMIAKMKEAGEPNEMIKQALQQNVKDIVVTTSDDEPRPMMMQIAESYTQLLEQFKRMDDERRREHDELMNRLRLMDVEQGERIDVVKQSLEAENAELRKKLELLSDSLNNVSKQNESMKNVMTDRDKSLMEAIRSLDEIKQTQHQIATATEERKRGWWPFGRR